MTDTEGVIHYECRLTRRSHVVDETLLHALNHWRDQMRHRGWIGREAGRYGGLGFGNISLRHGGGFLISTTQTGGMERLSDAHVVHVTRAEPALNRIWAVGPAEPSSEAMTHAAVYAAETSAGAVIHVHAPEIWTAAARLGLPVTDNTIPYGTPAMAEAVADCARRGDRLIVMGGHEDGVLAWGETLDEAGETLLRLAPGV